jgi:large subunit ribosomal protein L30
MADSLRVTLRKSAIGHTAATGGTLRALGLRRVGQTVTVVDNEAVRGMLRAVRFLVSVEESAKGDAA